MKNEYFQNNVIDLRILGVIGSVCISRFPLGIRHRGTRLYDTLYLFSEFEHKYGSQYYILNGNILTTRY